MELLEESVAVLPATCHISVMGQAQYLSFSVLATSKVILG